MAYTDDELKTYFADIQEGSEASRQGAMDFTQRYQEDPEQARLLSDRLSGVLDSNSPYIQRARTKANEAAGSRGMLNSSMAAGAAEGAAIDRGLEVASGDVDVDKFNVGALNESQGRQYQAAEGFAGRTQDFQNQLGGAQGDYALETNIIDQEQQDKLEMEQKEYESQQLLQDTAHSQQMETDLLQYTSTQALEMMKQEGGLWAQFMQAHADISSADISGDQKDAQIALLGAQFENARLAIQEYQDIKITGEGLTDFDIKYLPPDGTERADLTTPTTIPEEELEAATVKVEEAGYNNLDEYLAAGNTMADLLSGLDFNQ